MADKKPANAFSIGLQVWLIFLSLFFLMGYPPGFSILLGGIIGLFAGIIRYYVQPENQNPPPEKPNANLDRLGNRLLQRFRRNEVEQPGETAPVQVMRKRLSKPVRRRR